jgi:hypothetical protein
MSHRYGAAEPRPSGMTGPLGLVVSMAPRSTAKRQDPPGTVQV